MTLDRSAHAGSATVGLPSSPTPRRWMIRRCARSIGSTTSPVSLITRVAGSGSMSRKYAWQPPDPPLAISMWHGRSARNAHSRCSCARSVDVDPQEPGLAHRLLRRRAVRTAPPGRRTPPPHARRAARRARATPRASPPDRPRRLRGNDRRVGVWSCAAGPRACSLLRARPTRRCARAASRAAAPGGVRARDRRRTRARQRAGSGSAALRAACLRDPVRGRRWLWSSRPPCSDMASVGSRPARCCVPSRFAR